MRAAYDDGDGRGDCVLLSHRRQPCRMGSVEQEKRALGRIERKHSGPPAGVLGNEGFALPTWARIWLWSVLRGPVMSVFRSPEPDLRASRRP